MALRLLQHSPLLVHALNIQIERGICLVHVSTVYAVYAGLLFHVLCDSQFNCLETGTSHASVAY